MKKTRKLIKGISLKLDALFLRNLTLILATILIWRGIWNFADKYFLPHDFILSNTITIAIGLFLLFVFDTEVEETEEEIEEMEKLESGSNHKHRHLLNDHI